MQNLQVSAAPVSGSDSHTSDLIRGECEWWRRCAARRWPDCRATFSDSHPRSAQTSVAAASNYPSSLSGRRSGPVFWSQPPGRSTNAQTRACCIGVCAWRSCRTTAAIKITTRRWASPISLYSFRTPARKEW